MLISKIRSEWNGISEKLGARKSAALINTLCPAVLPLLFIGNTWPRGTNNSSFTASFIMSLVPLERENRDPKGNLLFKHSYPVLGIYLTEFVQPST